MPGSSYEFKISLSASTRASRSDFFSFNCSSLVVFGLALRNSASWVCASLNNLPCFNSNCSRRSYHAEFNSYIRYTSQLIPSTCPNLLQSCNQLGREKLISSFHTHTIFPWRIFPWWINDQRTSTLAWNHRNLLVVALLLHRLHNLGCCNITYCTQR